MPQHPTPIQTPIQTSLPSSALPACSLLYTPLCSPILREMNQVLFNGGRGNEEFANLPRKINVCISPSRDDFPHTQARGAGWAQSATSAWITLLLLSLLLLSLTPIRHPCALCVTPPRCICCSTQINDLGFEAVTHPDTGDLLFNVVVGGYFSLKRNMMSLPLGIALTQEQLIPFTVALLRVFR
jgi:ferredoxin-nitrite reductase